MIGGEIIFLTEKKLFLMVQKGSNRRSGCRGLGLVGATIFSFQGQILRCLTVVVGNIPLTTDLVLEYVLCVKSVEQILNLVEPLSTSKCSIFSNGS